MKPPSFQYRPATSLDEAIALRSDHASDSAVLAGGQSLTPMLNSRRACPGTIIDIGAVRELMGVTHRGDRIVLGAMTRQRVAERSQLISQRLPLVTQALGNMAHVPIRNRGTIGGSLAHADPAGELPAVALALDADLIARSSRGDRTIPADQFFGGAFTTALAPDELLIEIQLPLIASSEGCAFLELTRRHNDMALVGVAACVVRDGEAIVDARIAFTGVDSVPVRARAAEALLRGVVPAADVFAEAAAVATNEIDPGSDIHATGRYRRHIAGVLTLRALTKATRR